MTLNEYWCYAEGRAKAKEFELHNSRLIMWSVMQPHLRKGKNLKPSDIIELSFDRQKKVLKPNVSRDEFIKKANKIKVRWQRITKP